jgi:tagatose-1,6-bisphosphate aldolase
VNNNDRIITVALVAHNESEGIYLSTIFSANIMARGKLVLVEFDGTILKKADEDFWPDEFIENQDLVGYVSDWIARYLKEYGANACEHIFVVSSRDTKVEALSRQYCEKLASTLPSQEWDIISIVLKYNEHESDRYKESSTSECFAISPFAFRE